MSVENTMTDPTATTTEGDPTSQQAEQIPATGADTAGQQQHNEGQENENVEGNEVEGQEADETDKPNGAPDAYEFAAPEGQVYDPQVVEQFADVARELNLPQDAAQKVLDKMAPVLAERQAAQIQAVHEQWATDAKADPEFGGDKMPENLALAKKAMDGFASPELRTLLNETGMGNNPEVIRLFVRVGKAISEDGFVSGGKPSGEQAGDARSFYPNSNMN